MPILCTLLNNTKSLIILFIVVQNYPNLLLELLCKCCNNNSLPFALVHVHGLIGFEGAVPYFYA